MIKSKIILNKIITTQFKQNFYKKKTKIKIQLHKSSKKEANHNQVNRIESAIVGSERVRFFVFYS